MKGGKLVKLNLIYILENQFERLQQNIGYKIDFCSFKVILLILKSLPIILFKFTGMPNKIYVFFNR